MNYSAYDLPTIEFHNELYGYLQEKQQKYTIDGIEAYLVDKGVGRTKKWAKISNGQAQQPQDVTLMTYIRNLIHHPENTLNQKYTGKELKESIEKLIGLL